MAAEASEAKFRSERSGFISHGNVPLMLYSPWHRRGPIWDVQKPLSAKARAAKSLVRLSVASM